MADDGKKENTSRSKHLPHKISRNTHVPYAEGESNPYRLLEPCCSVQRMEGKDDNHFTVGVMTVRNEA